MEYQLQLPRHAEIWLPEYLKGRLRSIAQSRPKKIWLAVCDHWEPLGEHASEQTAAERVALWMAKWPRVAERFRDSAGRTPKYTFFYPQEEYRAQFLDSLASLTERGLGDVEVHIHHDGEGEQNFVDRMSFFTEV